MLVACRVRGLNASPLILKLVSMLGESNDGSAKAMIPAESEM